MAMSATRMEYLTWRLIYGGLLLAGLGWFIGSAALPWLFAAGAVPVLAGVVLIVMRSRLPD